MVLHKALHANTTLHWEQLRLVFKGILNLCVQVSYLIKAFKGYSCCVCIIQEEKGF